MFDNVYKQEYIIVNTLYTSMSFKNNVKINSTLHVNTCCAEITKIEGASSGLKIEGASSGLKIEGASSGLNIFLVHVHVQLYMYI